MVVPLWKCNLHYQHPAHPWLSSRSAPHVLTTQSPKLHSLSSCLLTVKESIPLKEYRLPSLLVLRLFWFLPRLHAIFHVLVCLQTFPKVLQYQHTNFWLLTQIVPPWTPKSCPQADWTWEQPEPSPCHPRHIDSGAMPRLWQAGTETLLSSVLSDSTNDL